MKGTPFPRLERALVAILRGITHIEAEGIVSTLIETGFEAIEIPLNSPNPFVSIEIAAKLAPLGCIIGAGTVLNPQSVDDLHQAGGKLVVTPCIDLDVIGRAHECGMITMPGVFTPTEALAAVRASASAVKFFPANVHGPGGIAAIGAVLPRDLVTAAVGGITEADFKSYFDVGVTTFGLGSSLYKPGMTPRDVRSRARRAIAKYDEALGRC